ncbi:MAG: hypothetical protein ACI4EV_06000 [Lachnospiraceae bacterium]
MPEKERGSITVEASMSITAFVFGIVTILSVINICMVQARMAYAINSAAKELSQYSYMYSLTGIPNSVSKVKQNADGTQQDINDILKNVDEAFSAIDNLGKNAGDAYSNVVAGQGVSIESISNDWKSIVGSADDVKSSATSLYEKFSSIADNPKKLIFGIASMVQVEAMDLITSRLIAAPLAKLMVKKHLTNESGGSAEAYLKSMRIIPSEVTGSYMGGLDFSKSTLFPGGSSEITITVEYSAKIIPLLPIKTTYKFCQTAKTTGWLAGDVSFSSGQKYIDNDTLWTEATVTERSGFIRHQVLADLSKAGYNQVSGLTDVSAYSEEKKEFVLISSMNPLWSEKGSDPKKLEDISDEAVKMAVEQLAANAKSSTDRKKKVSIKVKDEYGVVTTKEVDCSGASNKVILVIPQDNGLKEKIEGIIAKSQTKGVTIEVQASYGNGASKTAESEGEE